MQFVQPNILFALFALVIPILLHLFFLRKAPKVYFSNVRLLKNIQESKRTSHKLKELLVLISRLLAMAALIFAFAQPFLPSKEGNEAKRKAIAIFVDNSFSMASRKDNLPLLEIAKQRAESIAKSFSPADDFYLFTQDLHTTQQKKLSQTEILSLIAQLSVTPASQSYHEVYRKISLALSKNDFSPYVYWVSDFQTNELPDFTVTDSLHQFIVPVYASKPANVSVDSCWALNPTMILDEINPMVVKCFNHSDEDIEQVSIRYIFNGVERPGGTLSIPARSFGQDTINVSGVQKGWNTLQVSIEDAPIQFDDVLDITFEVNEAVKILALYDQIPSPYVAALFKESSDVLMNQQDIRKIDFSQLQQYDLIIFENLDVLSSGLETAIQSYVTGGGNLLVFPNNNGSVNSINRFLNTVETDNFGEMINEPKEVSYIALKDEIFNNVFENESEKFKLPKTTVSHTINSSPRNSSVSLMKYRNGQSFLSKYLYENGFVVICAASLDSEQNDFVKNYALFVPFIHKLAMVKGSMAPLYQTIGDAKPLILDNNKNVSTDKLINIKGKEQDVIASQKISKEKIIIFPKDNVSKQGIYQLMIQNDTISQLAFNYNRSESVTTYWADDELLETFKGSKILKGDNPQEFDRNMVSAFKGKYFWKWCIVLSLLFLLLEILIIRYWKN